MSFAREKRLLLGLVALLAPLPLPLNEVLEWPVLVAYLLALGLFLNRAWRDRPHWLPAWGMNLLGLLYLPIFAFDLLMLSGGGIVRPVVHLALFAVVVKLLSLSRERDKWQALMGIFFLFLAGMATSVHPSVVLYLLVFLGLTLLLLARFAYLHLLAGFGREAVAPVAVPFKGFLTLAMLASLLIAIPLFALLPRVRSPYITSTGISSGPRTETAGFSDEVTLDSIGRVRTSREVAMRIQFEGELETLISRRDNMRFKAATFEVYQERRWERSERQEVLYNPQRSRLYELAEVPAERWARIWLQPLNSRSLVLPLETARLELPILRLDVDRGGAVSLPFVPSDVMTYRVAVAPEPLSLARPPEGEEEGALDPTGISPRMAQLASQVMGEGPEATRVERLERHLMEEYEYTLDFVGRTGEEPLEDFLFRYKSGHCEYFATAMVLMLRSQGVPARLVTGFLGAEYNPLEGYFIVRQGNAHAWVEAYLPEEGRWRTYDPTPPVGRPTGGVGGLWSVATQAYDYVLFRWDRYVLSYDFEDQLYFFGNLRRALTELWSRFHRDAGSGSQSLDDLGGEASSSLEPGVPERWPPALWVVAMVLALALAAAAGLLWHRLRRPLTVERAYRRLRLELERGGLAVEDTDPPLALRRQALRRYPEASAPTGRVFDLYLKQSFAGQPLDEGELDELRRSLGESIRRLRKAG